MSGEAFISYSQNHEDVVLWRALNSVQGGHYIDVGAHDPVVHSVTKALYDRGWNGVNIEPLPEIADELRTARPRDRTVQAAITSDSAPTITLHGFEGTGLSTLDADVAQGHMSAGFAMADLEVPTARLDDIFALDGLSGVDVHILKIDVEGAEADVLSTVDLNKWRPWVLVIEATAPLAATPTYNGWEPSVLATGYQFCLFDGVSRFYVAEEHAAEYAPALSYPACALDDFIPVALLRAHEHTQQLASAKGELEAQNAQLWNDLVRWRGQALRGWAASAAEGAWHRELQDRLAATDAALQVAHGEVERIRATVSWRVTRPLRAARTLSRRAATQ